MTLYSDTFSRSGVLAGSAPEVGSTGVFWQSSGASVTCTGTQVSLPANGWAALAVGSGDADLSAQVTGGPYAGVFVRAAAGSVTTGWRLTSTQQTYSSGSYQTRNNYAAQYRVGGAITDSRDEVACPDIGSLSTRTQCGSDSFPSSYSQACGSYGSSVDYYLQGVYLTGTCQVYVPGSYTVYSSQLVNPAGTVVWSGQTAYAPVLRLRAQGSAVTAWVNGTQVYAGTDADQASRLRTSHGLMAGASNATFDAFTLDTLNTPPNAPIITAPENNSVIDRTQVTTLAWTFNDPDPNDRQSKFDLQIRKVGDPQWVLISRETPTTSFDNAANNLTDGAQFEWQVRTYDSQGVIGPWSATSYFRAGTPPPPPTWLAPTASGQIPTESYLAQWSSASQVTFQVQVFADAAGIPTGAALYDSGAVTSTRRELQLLFSTNNVARHLRVRVQAGGLWSTWATVRATVSYTPPAVTGVFVTADDLAGRIFVDLRDPAPTGTQPAVLFHDLYRTEGAGGEQRVATNLPLNGTWIDWTPTSGVEQLYRVVAYGSNGVTSTSAPTA